MIAIFENSKGCCTYFCAPPKVASAVETHSGEHDGHVAGVPPLDKDRWQAESCKGIGCWLEGRLQHGDVGQGERSNRCVWFS